VLILGLVKCSIKQVEKSPDKAELANLEIHTVKDQSAVVESEVVKRDVQENNMEVELYDGETGITDKQKIPSTRCSDRLQGQLVKKYAIPT
jgi:hypothetical protein